MRIKLPRLDTRTPIVHFKPTNMVSYCEHVKVMVVPSIADLEDENLLETLWYTRRDYQQMKRQYTADLRTTNATRSNGHNSARATTSDSGTRRATTSTAVFGRFFLLVLLVYSGSCIAVMEGVVAFSPPPATIGTNYRHHRRSSSIVFPAAATGTAASTTETTTTLLLEPYLLVGIFGRLADKLYVVVATTDEEGGTSGMTGTAASGYEFGVLEAGRPKWLCTYPSRHGQSQGGGATVTHVPHWCSRLFAASTTTDENDENNDATTLLTKEKLLTILQEETFEMPLGAAPGLKQKAALPLQLSLSSLSKNEEEMEDGVEDSTTGMIVDCLWTLFAGGNTTTTNTTNEGGGEEQGVTQDAVAHNLKRMATDYGSNPDSMTYATFERAMQAQAQVQY